MTRRLSATLFVIVIAGMVVAGIVGAAAQVGDETAASISTRGYSFAATRLERGDAAKVAVVPIRGVIVSGESDPAGTVGSEDTVALIDRIAESDSFDGIILEVDSPGGGVLASAEIAAAVERARDSDVEVVSWMRQTAASGGYYVSADADRIVAAPDTITGSIGVILQYATVEELANKVGVDPVTIKSGKLKDMGSAFRELTPQERTLFQQLIDEAYAAFVDTVAQGRDMPESKVRELADGRIYTGRQAAANGLVDDLGLRPAVYDAMAKLLDEDADDLEIVEYARSFSFADVLLAESAQAGQAAAAARAAGELAKALLPGGASPGLVPRSAADASIRLEYRMTP